MLGGCSTKEVSVVLNMVNGPSSSDNVRLVGRMALTEKSSRHRRPVGLVQYLLLPLRRVSVSSRFCITICNPPYLSLPLLAWLSGTSRRSEPISHQHPDPDPSSLLQFCTSGKSTQNAFMFRPYKKLAKLSLKRVKLSCISCRCIKLASRSAMESASSANCGSSALIAGCEYPALLMLWPYPWASRSEERELGRRGVVGRDEGLGREDDLAIGPSMLFGIIAMRVE